MSLSTGMFRVFAVGRLFAVRRRRRCVTIDPTTNIHAFPQPSRPRACPRHTQVGTHLSPHIHDFNTYRSSERWSYDHLGDLVLERENRRET